MKIRYVSIAVFILTLDLQLLASAQDLTDMLDDKKADHLANAPSFARVASPKGGLTDMLDATKAEELERAPDLKKYQYEKLTNTDALRPRLRKRHIFEGLAAGAAGGALLLHLRNPQLIHSMVDETLAWMSRLGSSFAWNRLKEEAAVKEHTYVHRLIHGAPAKAGTAVKEST